MLHAKPATLAVGFLCLLSLTGCATARVFLDDTVRAASRTLPETASMDELAEAGARQLDEAMAADAAMARSVQDSRALATSYEMGPVMSEVCGFAVDVIVDGPPSDGYALFAKISESAQSLNPDVSLAQDAATVAAAFTSGDAESQVALAVLIFKKAYC